MEVKPMTEKDKTVLRQTAACLICMFLTIALLVGATEILGSRYIAMFVLTLCVLALVFLLPFRRADKQPTDKQP
jgi:hypothetical protein